jgi:glycosyltransferase involved in cell wall biosynthesis
MQLAFICQPYHRGGVTRWMVEAAAEWRRRGHAAWFVVPRPRGAFPSGGSRPTVIDLLDDVPRQHQPTRLEPRVGFEFELGTPTYRAGVYASAARRDIPAGVPIIVSDDEAAWRAGEILAWRNPFIGVLHADDRWYYDLAERYQRTVQALVAVSRRVMQRAREVVGSAVPGMETIPCGIPVPDLRAAGDESRKKDAPARLIWIGRIEERQKRVSDLGRITSAVAMGGMSVELDVVGDGYDIPLIQAEVAPSLAPHVRFHGWVSGAEVSGMLSAADVLLLPSNFEGMPLAAMEALAHGCAVVASCSSGLEEYAERSEIRDCLWIHPVGDVAAAASAVQEALAVDPVRRSAAARRFAQAEFSIGTCIDRYERLLASLPTGSLNADVAWRPSLATSLLSWGLAAARGGRRWLGDRVRQGEKSPSSCAEARHVQ